MTTDTITIEEARAIVYGLDPGALARRVWRAASPEGGRERNAAAVLDLADGAIRVVVWRDGETAPVPWGCVVVAWTCGAARERTRRSLRETTEVAPSAEVVEEEIARRAAGERPCWPSIEEQLRIAYARAA